jgi:hypothetical protein
MFIFILFYIYANKYVIKYKYKLIYINWPYVFYTLNFYLSFIVILLSLLAIDLHISNVKTDHVDEVNQVNDNDTILDSTIQGSVYPIFLNCTLLLFKI